MPPTCLNLQLVLVAVLVLLSTMTTTWGAHANSIADWGAEPLQDGARCDVAIVRRANREHLHLILEELVNTTFFRLFRVGLDGECPSLSSPPSSSTPAITNNNNNDPPAAAASSCGVAPLASSFPFASPPAVSSSSSSSSSTGGGGGGGQCALQFTSDDDSKQRPSWMYHKEPVDKTISVEEKHSLNLDDMSCDSPDFWFDLCDGLVLPQPTSTGWVNLQLNPERHTGYNGSKVWQRIYDQAKFDDDHHNNDSSREQRVLTRLLSGLHASVNTHISLFYYPPDASSKQWQPNPQRFMETVGRHPDRLRNLNFAFVVLLRALKKSSAVLNSFSYAVAEDEWENQRTQQLVRRLLESHLMSSCSQVFDSFDESSLFQQQHRGNGNGGNGLKHKFKSAFRAISETFNCIKCQKCRLHGKMQLTGLGTALKILLLPEVSRVDLKREEVVALFNTLHKMSHAIDSIDHLTELSLQPWVPPTTVTPPAVAPVAEQPPIPGHDDDDDDALEASVRSIARAYFHGKLTADEETALLSVAASRQQGRKDVVLGALAKHYGHDETRFVLHAKQLVLQQQQPPLAKTATTPVVVVIGSGLAGSTCVLRLLDGGFAGRVVLVEKRAVLGGNSAYASSGMNAPASEHVTGDSWRKFAEDVAKSSGRGSAFQHHPLVVALTRDSPSALDWVRRRTRLDFSQLGQLGGHSYPRTWRPSQGLAGSELLHAIHHAYNEYIADGRLRVVKSARVVDVVEEDGSFSVKVEQDGDVLLSGEDERITHVVFATGGFAANQSMMPAELADFKTTTNMAGATGDAVPILQRLGAAFVDMHLVQLHPTAFVVEKNSTQQQPLCAEILRGVGGVLLNAKGQRFCNELGTRAYVSQRMREEQQQDQPWFTLVLSQEQADAAGIFPKMYTNKGLLKRVHSLQEVDEYVGVGVGKVRAALERYVKAATTGGDEFGKREFTNSSSLLTSPVYYVGRVKPALHYCMGGIAVDDQGQVLSKSTSAKAPLVPGRLFAVGEVSGGVHGDNRLGGNGMTEALVFGARVADTILLQGSSSSTVDKPTPAPTPAPTPPVLRTISPAELKERGWIAIRGKVYDFAEFAPNHPGGASVIDALRGTDGTDTFEEIHTISLLEDFVPVGRI